MHDMIWLGDHLFLNGDARPWVLNTIKSFDPDTEIEVEYQPEGIIMAAKRSNISRRCSIGEAIDYYDSNGLSNWSNDGMKEKAARGL